MVSAIFGQTAFETSDAHAKLLFFSPHGTAAATHPHTGRLTNMSMRFLAPFHRRAPLPPLPAALRSTLRPPRACREMRTPRGAHEADAAAAVSSSSSASACHHERRHTPASACAEPHVSPPPEMQRWSERAEGREKRAHVSALHVFSSRWLDWCRVAAAVAPVASTLLRFVALCRCCG